MRIIPVLMLFFISGAFASEEFGWKNRDGSLAPNTDNMKSINGFGGWLIVTPDQDWEEKWNTPTETTPHFSEASEVSYGEQLTILTFFGNPSINKDGAIEVLCDIKIERPDGSYSINEKDIECAKGKLHGSPYSLRLTQTIIKYVGDPGDIPGLWKVSVILKDKLKSISIPLNTEFTLLAGEANK